MGGRIGLLVADEPLSSVVKRMPVNRIMPAARSLKKKKDCTHRLEYIKKSWFNWSGKNSIKPLIKVITP